MAKEFYIVFDGPPGPEAAKFIEVEDAQRRSVRVGEWTAAGGGYWKLGPFQEVPGAEVERLRAAIQDVPHYEDCKTYFGFSCDCNLQKWLDQALNPPA